MPTERIVEVEKIVYVPEVTEISRKYLQETPIIIDNRGTTETMVPVIVEKEVEKIVEKIVEVPLI